ncbi:hypothetical protein B0H12DRAFT_1233883 [Mycena haematopus]|nr:hypothetical protein B0H12DRAFT_1242831 [Mycena haematopus]KAJ7252802.1 hypothetical protein B0H12DRAFT_1233883 [Mycena haematopus]
MGKCSTSVLVSVPGVKPLNVDTLDAIVDEVTLSWTVESTSPRPRRLELRFATLRQLKSFVFALCFVRYTRGRATGNHGCSLWANISRAARVVEADTDGSYLENLEEIFVQLRSKAQAAQYSFNALPVELIAEIFLFCAPLLHVEEHRRGNGRAMEDTLLQPEPVVVHEGEIDRHRSLFDRGGSPVSHNESLAPFLFELVRTLHISSPHFQLYRLLESVGGSSMATLQLVNILISAPRFESWTPDVPLFRSAPLLHDLTIRGARVFTSAQLSPTFVAAFPWSQLTVLTLKLFVGISVWIPIFSQCRVLRTAHFVVWDDGSTPRYPVAPVALDHLESLRVTFRGGLFETTFFDHFTFTALHTLHITGLMHPNRRQALTVVPALKNLRALFLDVPGLAPCALQSILALHPPLEQFSFIIHHTLAPYAPVFQQLRHDYRLRSLTMYTSSVDDPKDFTAHIVPWVVEQASISECEIRLFGKADILDALRNALTEVGDVDAVDEFMDTDHFDHPFAIFPYSRMISLVLRQSWRASGTTLPCIVSSTALTSVL